MKMFYEGAWEMGWPRAARPCIPRDMDRIEMDSRVAKEDAGILGFQEE
ncbi:MAG: hypothetical protein ACHQKY_10315 [Terriglobia bacterium]